MEGIQKINVIGGSGFIGSRLIARLNNREDLKVTVIDKVKPEPPLSSYDVADVRSLQDLNRALESRSIVINLAAEHRDNVEPISLYNEVNVIGAQNICKCAREKDIEKIIFTSSVAVYGFAPIGTDEAGHISPFNEYGKSKSEAENIFRNWQTEKPDIRTLIIIRPTVVFGENNRGNVYNLLAQIFKRNFVMIGKGNNRKSIAYVENIAAFIEYCLDLNSGIHIFNYADKPDFTMNDFVENTQNALRRTPRIRLRFPLWLGLFIGSSFDCLAKITGKKFSISKIRVEKFTSNSVYGTRVSETSFVPPVDLRNAIQDTVFYEFIAK